MRKRPGRGLTSAAVPSTCCASGSPSPRRSGARGYGWSHRDATELVRIHLWEGDLGAAPADAREGGCRQEVWLALAEALEDDEPWEAMIIHREQVEPTIERRRKADYREAADMLARVRDLMDRTGHGDEFPVYLEEFARGTGASAT
jgi:hypothetical protein